MDGEAKAQRILNRIGDSQHLGPDAQVDDKALAFAPTDPSLTDPFLVMAEDWFSIPGFEWHPHRGLETVTFVIDGVLEHGDNLGHAGALEPGEVQWMTAGHGIIHRELAYRDEQAHILQLWLNLPAEAKLVPAGYQDLVSATMPRVTHPGVSIDVHSGTIEAVTGTARNQHPVQGAVLTLDPGARYQLAVPADPRLFAYVLDGSGYIGGTPLQAGQVGWSDPDPEPAADGTSLDLVATDRDQRLRVMVYSSAPLGEPVALGGPFVMNSGAEIAQAYRDLNAGEFGPVPNAARFAHDR